MAVNANIPYSIAQNAAEFLAGIASDIKAASVKDIQDKLEQQKIVEKLETDMRDLYDRFIPNIHVVSVDNYFNLLVNNLVKNFDKFVDDGNQEVLTKISTKDSDEYSLLYASVSRHISKYHSSLLASQGGNTNPIEKLDEISQKLFRRTRDIDNAIAARYLGFEFSRTIRAVFGNRAVLAAIDTSISNDYIFLSNSFNSIVSSFKDKVSSLIEADLKLLLGASARKSISIGSVINFGHAAIKSDTSYYVNSPAFANALFGVGSGRSSRFTKAQLTEAAQAFKQESRIIDNSIEVSKSFSMDGKYKTLLSLGVTFTIPEDAAINQLRGVTTEKSALKSLGIAKPTPKTRSERIRYVQVLAGRAYKKLTNNIIKGTSSRSLEEFITASFSGIFNKKPVLEERSKKTISNKAKIAGISKQSTKPTKLHIPKPQVPKVRPLKPPQASLANLEAILRAGINQQVASNMGTGSDRRILNYRTGRLADSVSIDRVSESRQGMISVFYNYMKNPYATFSDGGRQQSPKTRDPKALISKSIRELAAPIVGNRLRSVLV